MSLGNALSYLTILPVPYKKRIPLVRSLHYFPLVGAGLGSIAVLFFLGAKHFLPDALACFITIAGLEVVYGGVPIHGVAEMAQGRRSYHPGHGFDPGFKLGMRGFVAVTGLLLIKTAALITLPREFQARAVFVMPILGRCAQTLALVLSPHGLSRSYARDPKIVRRRVRAGLWSLTLLLLLFLFPWRAAIPALILFGLISVWGLRLCNTRFQGLTLQTVSLLAEVSETLVLAMLATIVKILT